ncbi:hypothetical protein L1265_05050 [Tenacibaculum sp. Cn5-1]|uniref:hypothetical protein n=1 Tax=Tenacibaculum sp. Cn5-1 TaxID=2908884 RepID=UPI001F48F041|nr:hypothetical protein [Tenacibaculum sp. Cn5-1]MCF2874052.1 hypothetical protein [Tenacibaculum sp. Cn5-1]
MMKIIAIPKENIIIRFTACLSFIGISKSSNNLFKEFELIGKDFRVLKNRRI